MSLSNQIMSVAAYMFDIVPLLEALSKFSLDLDVITFTPLSGLSVFVNILTSIMQSMIFLGITVNVENALLVFADKVALTLFLPIGVVLRCFFATRRTGGALIALAVGVYLIFPLLLSLNAIAVNQALVSDFAPLTTAASTLSGLNFFQTFQTAGDFADPSKISSYEDAMGKSGNAIMAALSALPSVLVTYFSAYRGADRHPADSRPHHHRHRHQGACHAVRGRSPSWEAGLMHSEILTNKRMAIAVVAAQLVLLAVLLLFPNPIIAILAALSFVAAASVWRFGYLLKPIITKQAGIIEGFGKFEIPSSQDIIVKKQGDRYFASSYLLIKFPHSATEKTPEQISLMKQSYQRSISSISSVCKISNMVCPVDLTKYTDRIKENRSRAESRLSELEALPPSANSWGRGSPAKARDRVLRDATREAIGRREADQDAEFRDDLRFGHIDRRGYRQGKGASRGIKGSARGHP